MRLDRVEIWDGLEADSGNHLATIRRAELLAAQLVEDVNGSSVITIRFDRASVAWDEVVVERVLRAVYDDDSVEEYRISKPDEERTTAGAEQAILSARSVLYDLRHGQVNRVEADGTVTIFYTLLGQTRAALVAHILADARAYFTAGTITDSTSEVDVFTFNNDSPISALQELAAIEGLELAIRRNGDTDFLVDLVDAVGSGATVPEFRYRKNMLSVKRSLDNTRQANRIYAAGGGDDAVRLGLGQAVFKVVTVVSPTVVEVSGDPIYTDDHLVGEYLERPDLTRVLIDATIESTQRVETNSAHNLNVGDRFQFRADASGTWLTYVEDPDSQATYGILTATIDENDLSPVSNLLDNPKLTDWTGDLPADWTKVGAPTTAEETDDDFTKVGGSSAKVTAALGEGIQADAVTIAPVDPHLFYSFHVDVYVASGKVEMYAQHSVDGRFPDEGEAADEKKQAFTSKTGEWATLRVEGKEWQAGTVQIRVVAKDGAAVFYVDAAQLTRTSKVYPFLDGDGGAKLWARALQQLGDRSLPVVTYQLGAMDLNAVDPATWPYDEVTLGGTVVVEDESLGLSVSTRVLKITRDLLQVALLQMQLSNKTEDLIDRLTLTARRTRQLDGARPSLALISQFKVTVQLDGTITLQLFGAGATKSFRYIVDVETMPTYAEVVDSAGDGVASNLVDGTEVDVTEIRNAGAQTQLGKNQRAFIRVVVFPVLSGGGTAGASDQAVTQGPTFWSATITGNTVSESGSTPNVTVKRSLVVDDRTSAVRVYRRKDNWPTVDDTQTGQLDPAYDRGMVDARDGWAYEDGGWATGDDVHDIVVAVDANGQDGERENPSPYTVTNTATPRFLTTTRTEVTGGVGCGSPREVELAWTTADVTTVSHDVRAYRIVDGGPPLLIETVLDPDVTEDYTDDELPMYTGGSAARRVDYRLDLWNGASVDDTVLLTETIGGSVWNLCDVEGPP